MIINACPIVSIMECLNAQIEESAAAGNHKKNDTQRLIEAINKRKEAFNKKEKAKT